MITPQEQIVRVAVKSSHGKPPKVLGYEPFFVNVNLERDPQKIISYKPVPGASRFR